MKKEENILMRILFCNIHCPFLCFCKPYTAAAAARLYAAASASPGSSGPLTLPPPPQPSPCRVVSVSDSSDQSFDDANDDDANAGLKSCIKKRKRKKKVPDAAADVAAEEETEKKKVQWVDEVGQELAEILEFESSECGDMDYEEENQSGCVCTIL